MTQLYLNPASIKEGSITIEKLDATATEVLGGVPIVDSIDSLDENAKQGSLAVVVKNYVETYSIRDSFVKNENPVALNELRLSEPNIEVEGNIEGTPFLFGPKGASIEDMTYGVSPCIGIIIVKNEETPLVLGAAGPDQIFEDYGTDGTIILYSNGVFDEEKLTIVNEYIKDKNFVFFGAENANYDDSQPIENILIDPTDEQFDLLDAFLGYEIVDKSTTLYIKESEGWKEFNLDVVNDFNGGIDKALSAEMGKVLNEKISGFIAGNTTEPIKFKGYVNVETTKDIDKIYDNMQIGEACLVAPSVKGDAATDSYVPWIYTATQNDYLPLGDGLLKADISKVLSGEIRTYFTLDKENPTWRCPDMLLLAKVKVKIKQFAEIIDMSSALKNILSLLPDSTEITACIGKILRWSIGDVMPQFVEEILKWFDESAETIGYKTKYPWGTKFDAMLTNGVSAYTPDTITSPLGGTITANWTGFVTCSTDSDSGGYYHFIQTAICRDSPRIGNMWIRMGYYRGSADSPTDLHFFSWNPVGMSIDQLQTLIMEIQYAIDEVLKDVTTKEITYSDLVWKRNNSELIPGTTYRITDYITTTTEENTKSANHQFDIIVTADSSNTLSHLAKAVLHEGDTYFENCNLSAWQLWYDIDNDTNKYAWADEENGKGVIYRMIDEHNNDCPYDFKNIMFYTDKYTENVTEDNYYYTFSYVVDNVLYDGTVESQVKNCYGNSMGVYLVSDKKFLNFNVFRNASFLNFCINNTFEGSCNTNTFGNNCSNNTFGRACYQIHFGNSCNTNTFGNSCNHVSFGNNFSNIKLENMCKSICLYSSTETTSSNELKNIKIMTGVYANPNTPLELTIEPNRDFETKVAKNSKGEIKIYCEADLIAE